MLITQWVEKIISSQPLDSAPITQLALEGIGDYFAASFLANQQPECLRLLSMIEQEGGHANSWLIGYNLLATAKQAALFNGFQAHLLDYDDVHEQVRGHPSAVILSALLSQINPTDPSLITITGQRFLAAYVVGIEVMARLGVAVGDSHYIKGWHNTATLGGIAATAAICYLRQEPFIAKAMAIAASQAAGLRLQFGSNMKPLHAGLAAQQAIQSVELCRNGFTANDDFLDGQMGFLALYGIGNHNLDLSHWGQPWRIQSPGLWFKDYPYCSANSYVADAVKAVMASNHIMLEQIQTIEIAFSAGGDAALIHRSPTIEAEGRFSAEYIIACLLQGKSLDESYFTEKNIDDDTTKLMAKIQRSYLSTSTSRCVNLVIELKDQRRLSTMIKQPKGSPTNPYNASEHFAKLTKSVGSELSVQKIYQILQNLNSMTSVSQVIDALQNEVRHIFNR